jgi:trimeric autotransporter adhesin
MRNVEKLIALCSLLFASFLIAPQNTNAQSSNVWSASGQMAQPRTGAASAPLSDGRILITGGSDSNGVPQASTEIFDPVTGQFSQGAPMNMPRANHAAITLNTGDVLITGGLTTGGGYSDTSEILNIQTGTWTLLEASLGTGLAKHAMAALPDGNVLIAGGESTTGPVLTLLLFRVSDGSISSVGSQLERMRRRRQLLMDEF